MIIGALPDLANRWRCSNIKYLVGARPVLYCGLTIPISSKNVKIISLFLLLFFQLEKTLKAQIDAWEQEHDKEFLVNGQKFLEYVQEQWEQHHTEKEQEKVERVCEILNFN